MFLALIEFDIRRKLTPIFYYTFFFLAGCGTVAQVENNQIEKRQHTLLNGKSIALRANYRIHEWNDDGMYLIGQKPKPGETHDVDYDSTRELKKGVVLQDSELGLGTRDLLGRFEPTLRQALQASGANVSGSAEDYQLNATLTFGPTPAPAYADYNFGKSLGMGLVTMGLAPKQYRLRTDYTLTLVLRDLRSGQLVKQEICKSDQEHAHSISQFDLSNVQQKHISAAKALFVDSLEGCLNDFLKAF